MLLASAWLLAQHSRSKTLLDPPLLLGISSEGILTVKRAKVNVTYMHVVYICVSVLMNYGCTTHPMYFALYYNWYKVSFI
jgi:hypothetical protein